MKFSRMFLVLTAALAATACSSTNTSRNLADPNVSGVTLAQQVCSLCHGITGRSINPNFPNLAGQQPAYFMAQMKEFRGHGRLDPAGFEYMWGISRSLTDEQIKGLADYYSSQASASITGATAQAVVLEDGKTLFENGLPDKGVPACNSCHGAQAQGSEQFPRLANQHSDYLFKQLMVFQRTDERPEGSIMKVVAHELTAKNMQDVATYLQDFPK